MLAPRPANDGVCSRPLRRAVLVFAHTPEEEARVKPLRSPLRGGRRQSTEAADVRRLHKTLLESALHAAAGVVDADVLLMTTGDVERGRALAEGIVPGARLRVFKQSGADFAARLEGAVERAFAAYAQVVVIGSDTPELDTGLLRAAFTWLDADVERKSPRAVLGPATDGGYYLLGLSGFTAAAFRGIPFGGAQVASRTLAALLCAGYKVHTLRSLSDVDDAGDLAALVQRLRRSLRPAERALLHIALRVLDGGQLRWPAALPSRLAWLRLGDVYSRGPPVC